VDARGNITVPGGDAGPIDFGAATDAGALGPGPLLFVGQLAP
jgi:hypothetical protein